MDSIQNPYGEGSVSQAESSSSTTLLRLVASGIPGDVLRGLPTMVIYEICFRVVVTAMAAPLVAWLVQRLVARSGSAAVSNEAIVRFLITPSGFAAVLALALGYLFGQLLLTAGLMAIAGMALSGRPVTVGRAVGVALRSSLLMLRFGFMQLIGLAILFAPFLGLAALTYGLLLSAHDINYYLAERPPSFYAAVRSGSAFGDFARETRRLLHTRLVRAADSAVRRRSDQVGVQVESREDCWRANSDRRLRPGLARFYRPSGAIHRAGLRIGRIARLDACRSASVGTGSDGRSGISPPGMALGCVGFSPGGRRQRSDCAVLRRTESRSRASLGGAFLHPNPRARSRPGGRGRCVWEV